MSRSRDASPTNVVQLRKTKEKDGNSAEAKWGRKVIKVGFCVVPSLLLRAQSRLGLNPTQLAILLQLCDFWWDDARKPFPSKKVLSDRLGIGERQIQRYMAELENAGLVKRVERYHSSGGRTSNTYDLSGLVARLRELEPDFREVEAEVRTRRREVTRRGYRNRKAKVLPLEET